MALWARRLLLDGSPEPRPASSKAPGGPPADVLASDRTEPCEPVVITPKFRQQIVATMQANPEMGVEELVARFEGVVHGSGPAVRRVVAEAGE